MASSPRPDPWVAPFAGFASFARVPYVREASAGQVAVLGVPFDLGTSNRPGSRFGPRAIREQSTYVGSYQSLGHWPWSCNLFQDHKLVDYGDVPGTLTWMGYPHRMLDGVKQSAGEIVQAGARVLGLGGDHMVAYPLIAAAAAQHGPLSLIHFDAHSDTWDMGGDLNHGTMFRVAADEGLLDPSRSIQIGMRTPNPDTMGFTVVDADTLLDQPLSATMEQALHIVGDAPVYVSFDIDFLDPAYAPGTGTPVSGGPTSRQARAMLRSLDGLNVVGADLVEVAPQYDTTDHTAITAATLALDLAHLLCHATEPHSRQART
jgi:agmatinase